MSKKRPNRSIINYLVKWFTLSIMGLTLIVPVFAQQEDTGAEEMTLFGGSTGPVPFSHSKHQDRISDCSECHHLFPQQTGAIENLKEQETLEKRQVMDELCVGCHRQRQQDGLESGPTSCFKCHIR